MSKKFLARIIETRTYEFEVTEEDLDDMGLPADCECAVEIRGAITNLNYEDWDFNIEVSAIVWEEL